jgi:hypothetical protein
MIAVLFVLMFWAKLIEFGLMSNYTPAPSNGSAA